MTQDGECVPFPNRLILQLDAPDGYRCFTELDTVDEPVHLGNFVPGSPDNSVTPGPAGLIVNGFENGTYRLTKTYEGVVDGGTYNGERDAWYLLSGSTEAAPAGVLNSSAKYIDHFTQISPPFDLGTTTLQGKTAYFTLPLIQGLDIGTPSYNILPSAPSFPAYLPTIDPNAFPLGVFCDYPPHAFYLQEQIPAVAALCPAALTCDVECIYNQMADCGVVPVAIQSAVTDRWQAFVRTQGFGFESSLYGGITSKWGVDVNGCTVYDSWKLTEVTFKAPKTWIQIFVRIICTNQPSGLGARHLQVVELEFRTYLIGSISTDPYTDSITGTCLTGGGHILDDYDSAYRVQLMGQYVGISWCNRIQRFPLLLTAPNWTIGDDTFLPSESNFDGYYNLFRGSISGTTVELIGEA